MKMREHVKQVSQKWHQLINRLAGITSKVSGPGQSKRKLLASAVLSTLLYAAPVWRKAIEKVSYLKILEKVNRRVAIMVSAAYSTVSTEADQLTAGIPPIDLQIIERERNYGAAKKEQTKHRKELTQEWQTRWNFYQGWAKTFVKDVDKWINRKWVETNYFLTQAMTGHGTFGTYLHKIRKKENPTCWFCEFPDDVSHTIFHCRNFSDERKLAAEKWGQTITETNIRDVMMESEEGWNIAAEIISAIMKKKADYEKRINRKKQQRSWFPPST